MRRKSFDHDTQYIVTWASEDARDSAWVYAECYPIDRKCAPHMPEAMYQLLVWIRDVDKAIPQWGGWAEQQLALHPDMWKYIEVEEVEA